MAHDTFFTDVNTVKAAVVGHELRGRRVYCITTDDLHTCDVKSINQTQNITQVEHPTAIDTLVPGSWKNIVTQNFRCYTSTLHKQRIHSTTPTITNSCIPNLTSAALCARLLSYRVYAAVCGSSYTFTSILSASACVTLAHSYQLLSNPHKSCGALFKLANSSSDNVIFIPYSAKFSFM